MAERVFPLVEEISRNPRAAAGDIAPSLFFPPSAEIGKPPRTPNRAVSRSKRSFRPQTRSSASRKLLARNNKFVPDTSWIDITRKCCVLSSPLNFICTAGSCDKEITSVRATEWLSDSCTLPWRIGPIVEPSCERRCVR